MGRLTNNNLTDLKVKKITCPTTSKTIDVRDGDGLILRVSQSGKKHWRYEYRVENQKKALPLGQYPRVSLKQARELSQKAKDLRLQGIDPAEHARQAITEAKQGQLRKGEELEKQLAEPMFQNLADEYIASLEGSPSQYGIKKAIYHDAVKQWKSRKANTITRRECVLLLDEVKKRAPVLSNRLHSYLKTMFKVGVQRGLIESNPMNDIAKPAPRADHRDNSSKALDQKQTKALYSALQSNPFDDIIRLMLLTGARPNEILSMKWQQIKDDVWTLGAGEHKAGHRRNRTISRPLIAPATQIIAKYNGIHEELVFPGPRGTAMPTSSLNHFVRRYRNHYGIEGFTPHHVRHTISTRMREIGIRPDIVERILGHIIDAGIMDVYNSYNYLPEMKSGLLTWNKWIVDVIKS